MRNPIDLVFTWYRSGRGERLGTDPRYTSPAFQINGFDNLHYSMIDRAEEFSTANPLEKCFLVIEKQMIEYLDSSLLHSKNSCLVPFENYCIETEKYIQKLENFLNTSRTEFTDSEMTNANVPREKDIDKFCIKESMVFENLREDYANRLEGLCKRYETEISDVYKLSSISKSSQNKHKDLSIKAFSKISQGSKYLRGKRI